MSQGTIPGRAGDTALATFKLRHGELHGSLGNTVPTMSTSALERTFASRGHGSELFEFAQTVAARLGAGR